MTTSLNFVECDRCGEVAPSVRRELIGNEVVQRCFDCINHVCRLCGEEVEEIEDLHQHHISYLFDIWVWVCQDCHNRIHHEDGFYDEYLPVYTRGQAKRDGWIKER